MDVGGHGPGVPGGRDRVRRTRLIAAAGCGVGLAALAVAAPLAGRVAAAEPVSCSIALDPAAIAVGGTVEAYGDVFPALADSILIRFEKAGSPTISHRQRTGPDGHYDTPTFSFESASDAGTWRVTVDATGALIAPCHAETTLAVSPRGPAASSAPTATAAPVMLPPTTATGGTADGTQSSAGAVPPRGPAGAALVALGLAAGLVLGWRRGAGGRRPA